MKIKSEQELHEYRDIIVSMEETGTYPYEQILRMQSWWLREYERIVLCGYDFEPNYLHN